MAEENISYGLMVSRVMRYGRDYLEARVVARKGDSEYPQNTPSWYAYDQKPYFEDLLMSGTAYSHGDGDAYFSLDNPEFTECRGVGLAQAKGMVKTLAAIGKQIEKDGAQEAGDRFLAFARGIGAKWVVVPRKGRMERSSYDENRWAWYGLTDGRNAYRRMKDEMLSEEQQRVDEIAKAKAPVLAITDDRAA